MKQLLFTTLILLCSSVGFAQTTTYRCFIAISYDAVGNRTQREWKCENVVAPPNPDTNGDGVVDENDSIPMDDDNIGGGNQRKKNTIVISAKNAWSMQLFPNPTREHFTIQLSKIIKEGQLTIYTTRGEILLQEKIVDTDKLFAKMVHYSAGVYFVKVVETTTGITQTIKLIKEN